MLEDHIKMGLGVFVLFCFAVVYPCTLRGWVGVGGNEIAGDCLGVKLILEILLTKVALQEP